MTGLFGTSSYSGPASSPTASTASKRRTATPPVSVETRAWLRRCAEANLVLRAVETWSYVDDFTGLQEVRAHVTRVSPDSELAARWPGRFTPEPKRIGGVA